MWRGLFTSISAFCNAGFALQSNNLVSYQSSPLVLHTVAALIVLGGLAPATCLVLPDWIRGRAIPLAPRIALVTTATLLLAGTVCFLVFEWNNAMAELSFADKLHNAWFQSVTLRTAGFNSVDISGVLEPTFLIMLSFMFIGGSPGGTAGGVKTTTIGVLAMTFWASITGHNEVIAQNRRIPQSTINRAITVVGSGVLVWFFAVLALQITQQLPARDTGFRGDFGPGYGGIVTGRNTVSGRDWQNHYHTDHVYRPYRADDPVYPSESGCRSSRFAMSRCPHYLKLRDSPCPNKYSS